MVNPNRYIYIPFKKSFDGSFGFIVGKSFTIKNSVDLGGLGGRCPVQLCRLHELRCHDGAKAIAGPRRLLYF